MLSTCEKALLSGSDRSFYGRSDNTANERPNRVIAQ
jgi:hypothetical protein